MKGTEHTRFKSRATHATDPNTGELLMGTRSVLGYELPNGKIYAQYLQFDGYPCGQGKDYYISTLRGLIDLSHASSERGPTGQFFTRIKHLLNEFQYRSGHSVGNRFYATHNEWFGNGIDANQAWQHLWRRNGDFVIVKVGGDIQTVIPWAFTYQILKLHDSRLFDHIEEEGVKGEGWWNIIQFEAYEENKKVVAWGKDAALHLHDELRYTSSKDLRDLLLKGKSVTVPEPVFTMDVGEILAFPQYGQAPKLTLNGRPVNTDDGYRSYAGITIGTTLNAQKYDTQFADLKGVPRRNRVTLSAQYLRGKNRIRTDR
jgi:hypothetical protein